jgi:hypothetical protein
LWKGEDLQTINEIVERYDDIFRAARFSGHDPMLWQAWLDSARREDMIHSMLMMVQYELEQRVVPGTWAM